MIHLELDLTEVDFDALVELYLPQMLEKMKDKSNPLGAFMNPVLAKGILRTMNQQQKERLAVELINGNCDKIAELFEATAAQKGIRFKIAGAKATVI